MTPPPSTLLAPGLRLRCVASDSDASRFVVLNTAVNGEWEGAACDRLLRHRPEMGWGDFLIVEDERTGQVVSTTCLIPWRCRLAGIPLRVAMLEMVVTHPDYRHHGLVRAQIELFHRVAVERAFDLCLIQGIPYYYRQYGYTYAIDHRGSDSLPTWRIPSGSEGQPAPCRLRPATTADAPLLARFYREAMEGVALYAERSSEEWRYLLDRAHYPAQVVERADTGQAAGYVVAPPGVGSPNPRETRLVEAAVQDAEVAWGVLRALRTVGVEEIILHWPPANTLVQLGRALGSQPQPAYQWLLRIPDVAGFLNRLAPVMEARLARSPYAGLTTALTINLFRQAYRLTIEVGMLRTEALGFVDSSMGADGGDLCIPPEAFTRLVLGYRTLAELRDAWPDIVVKPERRLLLDVLFPRLESALCMPY